MNKSKIRISKFRIILFLVVCAVMLITLPFSTFFENKIDSILRKNYGEYATAIEQNFVVHVINVGNADCIALELPDGRKGLIDCGVDKKHPSQYEDDAVKYIKNVLFDGAENGTIDFFVLTHAHEDHCNNAVKIFEAFQIQKVYRPPVFYNGTNTEMKDDELNRAKAAGFVDDSVSELAGSSDVGVCNTKVYYDFLKAVYDEGSIVEYNYSNPKIKIENATAGYCLQYYSPTQLKYSEANDYSPIMVLSYKNHSICLTGDAEKGVEDAIYTTLPEVDVLKVGHHGGNTSTYDNFLGALKPKYALISCSSDNSYGHPNQKVLDRLNENGVSNNNILTTKDCGNLVFAISDDETIMIAASDGIIIAKIKWWYVCGTVVVIAAGIIFGITTNSKKSKKSR